MFINSTSPRNNHYKKLEFYDKKISVLEPFEVCKITLSIIGLQGPNMDTLGASYRGNLNIDMQASYCGKGTPIII